MFKSSLNLVKITPLLLLAAGLLFVGIYILRSIPISTVAFFTRVSEPTEYTFDSYKSLLQENVQNGLVDYKSLKSSNMLGKAMDELAKTSPTKLSIEGKACYWLNASNLITIKLITDRYPIKSFKEIGLDRASKKFVVAGKPISLQKLNSNKLMPVLLNREIPAESVFLINGGTLAYPPLSSKLITPKNLAAEAKVAAYRYITNEKNVYFDKDKGIFLISNLLNRYGRKFRQIDHTPYSITTLYLSEDKAPDLTDIMLTKSYFSKIDYRINALSKRETQDTKGKQASDHEVSNPATTSTPEKKKP